MACNAFTNQPIKVSLELQDGKVFTGRVMMSTLSVEQEPLEVTRWGDSARPFISTRSGWSMELQGTGSPTWTYGGDLAPGIAARILPQEWECEYCGRANDLKRQQCQSCGWYRGLIVDVVQEAGVWRVKR